MSDLGTVLRARLHDRRFGKPLHFFERIGSTNDEALALAKGGAPEGTLVLADEQTSGRGRRGRNWSSPPGTNLYLSLVLRPTFSPRHAPELVPAVAVAAAEAMRAAGAPAEIKWPNDLQIGGKKVAGILTELSARGDRIDFVVVGLGVNVNLAPDMLPPELQDVATSLAAALGRDLDRATFAADLLAHLQTWIDLHASRGFDPVRERYAALSATLHRRVCVTEGETTLEGVAEGIDEGGALLLRKDDQTLLRIHTGDVTSLRPLHSKARWRYRT